MTIKESKEKGRLPEHLTPVQIGASIMPANKCRGFCVAQKHIDARKARSTGVYAGHVPGCGGDVWWVHHEDGTMGAYLFDEIFDR